MQLAPHIITWFRENYVVSTTYITQSNDDATSDTSSSAEPPLTPSSSSSASLTNTNETDTNESLSSQQKSTSSTNTDNDSNNNSSNISDNSNNFINSINHQLQQDPCPFCLEDIVSSDNLISGSCKCTSNRRIHTQCLLESMESAKKTVEGPVNKLPTYVMKCIYCQTNLLGKDHKKFNDACLSYKRFVALSKEQKVQDWNQYLPLILQSIELVIQNIWKNWDVSSSSFNPILAAALGILAGCNGFIGTYASDATASSVAVFGYMMSWAETGPSAMFGVVGVGWVLNMLQEQTERENYNELVQMILPSVVSYLIIVTEFATEKNLQFEAQRYLIKILTERTGHDIALHGDFWQKIIYFLLEKVNISVNDNSDPNKNLVVLSNDFLTLLNDYMNVMVDKEVVKLLMEKLDMAEDGRLNEESERKRKRN